MKPGDIVGHALDFPSPSNALKVSNPITITHQLTIVKKRHLAENSTIRAKRISSAQHTSETFKVVGFKNSAHMDRKEKSNIVASEVTKFEFFKDLNVRQCKNYVFFVKIQSLSHMKWNIDQAIAVVCTGT